MGSNSSAEQCMGRRPGMLVVALAALAIIWLVVLPRLAEHPSQRTYREWLQLKRIDPSAMYYTELEALEPVLDRLNRQQRD